jgi:Xaa-Pro aminopeptidase
MPPGGRVAPGLPPPPREVEAELACVRRAAELADDALQAAVDHTRAGADEGVILARMHDAVFEGGGDYPGNPFIIGSGPGALLCRYFSGRRRLDPSTSSPSSSPASTASTTPA